MLYKWGYYTMKFPELPECLCNEGKACQVVAVPYHRPYDGIMEEHRWSMELGLDGECESDRWVHIKVVAHQLPPDQWESHINILKRAWKAARQ